MLARSRSIPLRNGLQIETPLLIPSFSSNAMGPLLRQITERKREPTVCSIVHSEILTDAIDEVLLVSAFDIHHSLLIDAESFKEGFRSSRYSKPRFLIIDSGWYEMTQRPDGTLFTNDELRQLEWNEDLYKQTINALDIDIQAVLVGFDNFGPYDEQIARAQDISGSQLRFAFTILLKAPQNNSYHNFDKLSGEDVSNLRQFDVIGVAEKELGDTILGRLRTLARFRIQLDNAGVSAPIHIFGGLDPLYTPLLFAAGAEIFDGLGWLRYAYRNGVTMNREVGALLDEPITKRQSQAQTAIQLRNLDELRYLSDEMLIFADNDGDWLKFRSGIGDSLGAIYERLKAELGVNRGR